MGCISNDISHFYGDKMKLKINLCWDYRYICKMLTTIFAGLMVSVFPLYLSDGYFYARHDKLNAFYILSSALIVLCTVSYILFDKRTPAEKLESRLSLRKLSVTDLAVLAFLLSAIISTILSDYRISSLYGDDGRNNGLILILLYTAVYFIVSRSFSATWVIPMLVCTFSALIALLAVFNQFYWDPFGLYSELDAGQYDKFLSTIGNRNILSAFLCITFPISFMSFVFSEKRHAMIFTATCTAINFCGILCSSSDSSILGTTLFIILAVLFYLRDTKILLKIFAMISAMLIFAKLILILSSVTDDYSMPFGIIQKYFIYGNNYPLIGIAVIITAILFIFRNRSISRNIQIISLVMSGISILTVIGIFVCYTYIDTTTKLSGVMKYFRFDDNWGTHRGFMWIRAFYIFGDGGIINKIFGFGPDSFKNVMDFFGYNNELKLFKNETTDCAHNVYLNYLVTVGIAGVASFVTAIISVIFRTIKKARNNKFAIIFASAVLCYSIQAIVNIDQPITTPLLVLMLALTENQNRKQNTGKE